MSYKLNVVNMIVYGLCSVVWFFNGFNKLAMVENICDNKKIIYIFVMAVLYGIVSLLNLYGLKRH